MVDNSRVVDLHGKLEDEVRFGLPDVDALKKGR